MGKRQSREWEQGDTDEEGVRYLPLLSIPLCIALRIIAMYYILKKIKQTIKTRMQEEPQMEHNQEQMNNIITLKGMRKKPTSPSNSGIQTVFLGCLGGSVG